MNAAARPPVLRWLFHGSAVVRDYHAAVGWLARYAGARVLEYSESTDPIVARNGGVTWIGDAGLELIEPTLPEGAPARFLERVGTGMYGIALQVENLETTAAWLTERGAEHVGAVDGGYLFTRPRHTAGVHLEWADKDFGDFDPHFGRAALPRFASAPAVDVERVAYFGALVERPRDALARLRELCPFDVLLEDASAGFGQMACAVSLVDSALALFAMPGDAAECERLWGLAPRPRVHLMALRVRELEEVEAVLRRDGVGILRGRPADGEIVVDPDASHGILIAYTDRDLPGDPRGPVEPSGSGCGD